MSREHRKKPDIIEAIKHPKIFKPLLGDLASWHSWIVWLKSVFGLLMDPAELELYRKCTGRTDQPQVLQRILCIVGRRGVSRESFPSLRYSSPASTTSRSTWLPASAGWFWLWLGTDYFRDYPEDLQRYREEVTGVNKRAGEDREKVNAEVHCRIEHIAYRDQLDFDKPVERVAAQTKLFAEDPGLYERYRAANTVRVGKVSMTD